VQHTDPATSRFLVRLGATHALRYLNRAEWCSGYINCCHCPDCTERSEAVDEYVKANPSVDHGEAARRLTEPRKRHAQPWEEDAQAA
jgi:hypothetical protein